MKTINNYLRGLLILMTMAFSVNATLLVEWDVANVENPDTTVPTCYLNSGLTAQNLSASGVTTISSLYSGYPGAFTAENWPISYDCNKYYSFSITADSGTNISIESIDLSLLRGDFGGGVGAQDWQLCSSLDAFASTTNHLAIYDISSSAINEQVPLTTSFDPALSLSSGQTMTFRLGGYYDDELSGDFSGIANMVPGDYDGDNITGTGTNLALYGQFIPEPSVFTSICILSLIFMRRWF